MPKLKPFQFIVSNEVGEKLDELYSLLLKSWYAVVNIF